MRWLGNKAVVLGVERNALSHVSSHTKYTESESIGASTASSKPAVHDMSVKIGTCDTVSKSRTRKRPTRE